MSGDQGLIIAVTMAVLLLVMVGVGLVLARCYRRCRADEALVRTGTEPIQVVIGGGFLVFPGMHQVQSISLRALRVPIEARGRDAVRSREDIRVELTLDLDLQVNATREGVLAAARFFGGRALDAASVREMIEIRAREVLRRAARDEDYFDLWDRREHLCERVSKDLRDPLGELGLSLRGVTLSGLAVVPLEQLDKNDILDCMAASAILSLTQPLQKRIFEIELAAKQERIQREYEEEMQALQADEERFKATLDPLQRQAYEADAEGRKRRAEARWKELMEEQERQDALAERGRGASGA